MKRASHLVTPKFDGFVERLDVRETGVKVESGQTLMQAWIESADLINMLIDVHAVADRPREYARIKQGLRLFDVPASDIDRIARGDNNFRSLTFKAPFSGTVLEKTALDGLRFDSGDMLFKIADLSTVWVMAEVPEQDMAALRVGQKVHLHLPGALDENLEGRLEFIYPDMNMATRSGRARIAVSNEDGALKIGQFAHTAIEAPVGDGPVLVVPASAVIDDGTRTVAFVSAGEGAFEPRDLTLGARAGDFLEVIEGLEEGEEIVVSGTFLIDAESNLQAALAAFSAGEDAQ